MYRVGTKLATQVSAQLAAGFRRCSIGASTLTLKLSLRGVPSSASISADSDSLVACGLWRNFATTPGNHDEAFLSTNDRTQNDSGTSTTTTSETKKRRGRSRGAPSNSDEVPIRVRKLSLADLEILSTRSLPESVDEWPQALRENEQSYQALRAQIQSRNLARAVAQSEYLKKREAERMAQQQEHGINVVPNHEHPWTILNKASKEAEQLKVFEALEQARKMEKEQGEEALLAAAVNDSVFAKAVKLLRKEKEELKKKKRKRLTSSTTPTGETASSSVQATPVVPADATSPSTETPEPAIPKGWMDPVVITEREVFGVDLGKYANPNGTLPTSPEDAQLLEKLKAKKLKKLQLQQKRLAKEAGQPIPQTQATTNEVQITDEELLRERHRQDSEAKLAQYVKLLNQDPVWTEADVAMLEASSAFDAMTSVAATNAVEHSVGNGNKEVASTDDYTSASESYQTKLQQTYRTKSFLALDKLHQQERLAALAVLRRKFLETMVTVLTAKQYDKFVQLFKRFRTRARKIMEGTDTMSQAAIEGQFHQLSQIAYDQSVKARAGANPQTTAPDDFAEQEQPALTQVEIDTMIKSRELHHRALAATTAAAKAIEEAVRKVDPSILAADQGIPAESASAQVIEAAHVTKDTNPTEVDEESDSLDHDLNSFVTVAEKMKKATPAAATVFEVASSMGLSLTPEASSETQKAGNPSSGGLAAAPAPVQQDGATPSSPAATSLTAQVAVTQESVRKAVAAAVEVLQQAEISSTRRRRQLLDAAVNSFYRQAIRIFEDEADVLTPMLARHLRQLTVKELESARERFASGTKMMKYVAAFVKAKPVPAGQRGIPDAIAEAGPVATALAYTSGLEVETDPTSPYLWSRLDALNKTAYKVYVEGLPPAATTREVTQAFSACGRIVAVEIFRGESAEAIASNEANENDPLVSTSALREAVRSKGEDLEANESIEGVDAPDSSGISTDLPPPLPKNPVKIANKPPRSYVHGFIYFQSPAGRAAALHPAIQLFGVCLHDAMVRTQPVEDKKTLFVTGFKRRMTHADIVATLRRILKPFLKNTAITAVHVPQASMSKNFGYAIVQFDSHESAVIAQRYLTGALLHWPPTSTPAPTSVQGAQQSSLPTMMPRQLQARWTSYRMDHEKPLDFRAHPLMSYYPYARAAATAAVQSAMTQQNLADASTQDNTASHDQSSTPEPGALFTATNKE